MVRNMLNVIKKIFLIWIQNDLRKYLKMVERKTLKNHIENILLQEEDTSKPTLYDSLYIIWDYITFLVINMYSEPESKQHTCENIKEEAEAIVMKFTDAFIHGMKLENESFVDFFPVPIQPMAQYVKDSVENIALLLNEYASSEKREVTKGKDTQACNDNRNIQGIVFYIRKLLGEGYGKFCLTFKPKSIHYVVMLLIIFYQLMNDLKQMLKKINVDLGTKGEIRCFYNMLNLYLHFMILHGRIVLTKRERELIFAVSALHPVQDDYIDNGNFTSKTLDVITRRLKGENVVLAEDTDSKVIFHLIDVIYNYYPPDRHAALIEILSNLQYWQCESQKQKGQCTLNEILCISFMKGGYAFALFGYMALGNMSMSQFNHFFSMGAIFQILDDLRDIKDDLQNGILTIWTRVANCRNEMDEAMKGILAVQKEYEQTVPLITDFIYPVLVRRIELFGVRYDIFKSFCIYKNLFSEGFGKSIKECFPFEIENISEYFLRNFRSEKRLEHLLYGLIGQIEMLYSSLAR